MAAQKDKEFKKIINNALNKNGNLNKTYLRDTIFKNKQKKKWLEKFIHPLVYKKIEPRANLTKSP